MAHSRFSQTRLSIAVVVLSLIVNSCTSSANSRYFGKTEVPKDNVMRYISGGEIESLDPAVTNSQVDARMMLAFYEGLVDYHPKTMQPIPSIAESWEISQDGTEYVFHLRKNAKFSDGTPITAKDFVYTFRRALSPELASRSSNFGYSLKYGEAFNSGGVFVKNPDGTFLLKKDFEESSAAVETHDSLGEASEAHKFLDSPERIVG
ncbi:MAG: hypothetical protein HC846_09280 [Blastocatellia bacterium]|nr:hypothetical protein [Blastocatellia bacterium]